MNCTYLTLSSCNSSFIEGHVINVEIGDLAMAKTLLFCLDQGSVVPEGQ